MSKTKHGEYMPMVWDSYYENPPEYIRGHVSHLEALSVLQSELGEPIPPFHIVHRYARLTFAPADADFDREYRFYDRPERGAFAVTEVQFTPAQKEPGDE